MKKIVMKKSVMVANFILIFLILCNCSSNKNMRFEGEWLMTHYIHKDSLILENNIDILPREAPYLSTISGYISMSGKQMAFNYDYHDKSINSKFDILPDAINPKFIITESEDSLFNGEYTFKYDSSIISSKTTDFKVKEEVLRLESDVNLIYFFRKNVIQEAMKKDYSRPRRPF